MQHACAQVTRTPFSTVFLLCHLTTTTTAADSPSHPSSSTLSRSFSLPPFPSLAPACSQFVSRVCAHTPYSGTAVASTRFAHPVPPCRSFAGSGPREDSCVVPSCRVTPSERHGRPALVDPTARDYNPCERVAVSRHAAAHRARVRWKDDVKGSRRVKHQKERGRTRSPTESAGKRARSKQRGGSDSICGERRGM